MIPLPLLDGDTFVIDNSALEGFQTCPRSAQYTISRRLRPTGERVPLKFGGIVHKVLETRYRAGTGMYEQTPEVTSAMLAVAGAEYAKWSPPEDDFRNYDCAVSLIQKYGEAYPYESFDIVSFTPDRPAIETPFALPLGVIHVDANFLIQPMQRDPTHGHLTPVGDPLSRFLSTIKILFTGKIDLIYRQSAGYYLMDHKTSSMATNMAEFELSHQFQGYTWAVETLLNEPVQGICINRVVCRKPTRTGSAFTFERKLIPTSRGILSEWRTDILHIIADYLEMSRRGYMPKHTAWCVGKFGTCPFHRVCLLDSPEQKEILLTSGDYQPNTWSPLTD